MNLWNIVSWVGLMKRNLNTNIFHPIIIIVSNLDVLYICTYYVRFHVFKFLIFFSKIIVCWLSNYQLLFIGPFKTSGNISWPASRGILKNHVTTKQNKISPALVSIFNVVNINVNEIVHPTISERLIDRRTFDFWHMQHHRFLKICFQYER